MLQPAVLHTFLAPPPCFLQSPFKTDSACVVQFSTPHFPKAPCLLHFPRAAVGVLHPSVEQTLLFLTRPLILSVECVDSFFVPSTDFATFPSMLDFWGGGRGGGAGIPSGDFGSSRTRNQQRSAAVLTARLVYPESAVIAAPKSTHVPETRFVEH